jgi:hypothetical protein
MEKPILLLSCQIEKLEVLSFRSLSHGDFLNVPNKCLVKCMGGYKLSFDLIFVADLARVLADTYSYFHYGS